MKIHKILLENLNSLYGKSEVDLEKDLNGSNIFAITGPTGAGKSTILDAICLALYGKTPRFSQSRKGEENVDLREEIMSRGTASSRAEVIFSNTKGMFKAYWGVHRARFKEDGQLQEIKREISEQDVEGNFRPIESYKSKVNDEIEKIIGLDFERFTKSILLAQGDFASFLKADSDTRASLLERITGTEIYSQLSRDSFDRANDAKKELEALTAHLENLDLPDEEEVEKLGQRENEFLKRIQESTEQENVYKNEEAWLVQLENLKFKLLSAENDLESISNAYKEFDIERKKLTMHNKALPHFNAYDVLQENKREEEEQAHEITILRNERVREEEDQQSLKEQTYTYKKSLTEFQIKKRQEERLWLDVSKLDEQIFHKSGELDDKEKELINHKDKIVGIENSIAQDKEKHHLKMQEYSQLENWLNGHRKFVELEKLLSGIKIIVERRDDQAYDLENKKKEIEMFRRQSKQADDELQKILIHKGHVQDHINDQESILAKKDEELGVLLEDYSHERMLDEIKKEQRTQKNYEKTIQLAEKGKEIVEYLKQKDKEIEENKKKIGSIEFEIRETTKELETSQERLRVLEHSVQRERDILDYNTQREYLVDGEPCPLCGSKEHPFVEQDENMLLESNSVLEKERIINSELEQKLRSQREKKIDCESNLKFIKENIVNRENELHRYASEWLQVESTLAWNPTGEHWQNEIEKIHEKMHQSEKKLDDLNKRFLEISEYQKLKEKIQNELKVKNQELADISAQEKDCEGEKKHNDNRVNELTESIERIQKDIEGSDHKLNAKLKRIDFAVPSDQMMKPTIEKWEQQILEYRENENRLKSVDKEKESLLANVANSERELRSLNTEKDRLNGKANEVRSSLKVLRTRRASIYQDKEVEKEKEKFNNLEDSMNKEMSALQDRKQECDKKVLMMIEKEDALNSNQKELQQKILRDVTRLKTDIMSIGMTDIDELKFVKLIDAEFKSLSDKNDKFKMEIDRSEGALRQIQNLLKEHELKNVSKRTLSGVRALLMEQQKELDSLKSKLGEIQYTIQQYDTKKEQHQILLENIKQKEYHFKKWDQLRLYIGQKDGKPFRKFAQGLTLERLINLANRHLSILSKRYLIRRIPATDLEMEVLDLWQGNTSRSIRNLSGGESFILSLSLALGLSEMASKGFNIRSMFIDEGFGTLDEESLDLVLDALDGLQSSGKMIGIISHVEMLKERIPAKLEIVRNSQGKSIIQKPREELELEAV